MVPLPTRRAAALLAAAGLVLWLVPVPVPFWAPLTGVAVLVVLDAARAPAPWRVGLERQLPPVLTLGTGGAVVWSVGNPSGRPLTVAVADELAPSLRPETRRFRVRVPPRGRIRASSVIRPGRRGTFRPAVVSVRVVGNLGLAARQAERLLGGRIEVHPSFRSRAAAELRIRRDRVLDEGLRALRARGSGAQFDALREYVEGDDVRRVDWAATARAGHPVVRTYRAERNQQVLALLDTGRLSAGLVDGVPRLDHAMDAVLALATIATGAGDRTGLLAFGATVRATVPPRSDPGQLSRLSTAMHALEPELAESDYHAAFQTALARFRGRVILVLFTELGAEAVQEQLVPALPLLTRRHEVVVVAVADPALDRLRDAPGVRESDVYAAAGAVAVADARSRAAGLLRRLGATVVDAPPAELAGAVGDAYLERKAAGR